MSLSVMQLKPGSEDLFNFIKLILKNKPVLYNITEKLKRGKEVTKTCLVTTTAQPGSVFLSIAI